MWFNFFSRKVLYMVIISLYHYITIYLYHYISISLYIYIFIFIPGTIINELQTQTTTRKFNSFSLWFESLFVELNLNLHSWFAATLNMSNLMPMVRFVKWTLLVTCCILPVLKYFQSSFNCTNTNNHLIKIENINGKCLAVLLIM